MTGIRTRLDDKLPFVNAQQAIKSCIIYLTDCPEELHAQYGLSRRFKIDTPMLHVPDLYQD
jgi:hypothetical protein